MPVSGCSRANRQKLGIITAAPPSRERRLVSWLRCAQVRCTISRELAVLADGLDTSGHSQHERLSLYEWCMKRISFLVEMTSVAPCRAVTNSIPYSAAGVSRQLGS